MAEITRLTRLDELPEMCRAEEIAAYLGTSKGMVYAMVHSGQLASIRLGRLLRIPREGLAAVVKS